MSSSVYFIDMRAKYKENFIDKLGKLLEIAGLDQTVKKGGLTAIKLHFGEIGNTAYIRPVFIRKVVECIKEIGGVPFLTDANTLYAGNRSDAPHHLVTAVQNGFAYSVVDAPVVIADGLRGKSETAVIINKKHFKRAYIGTEIVQADSLISVAHFKGHELSGFAGTIKNVGMGCASRKGKMAQHADVAPKVKAKDCVGCGECVEHCPAKAIALVGNKAQINDDQCIGCGECVIVCPNEAVKIQWNASVPLFMEKMVEYTWSLFAIDVRNIMIEEKKALTTTPAKSKLVVLRFPAKYPMAHTNHTVNKAPTNANICSPPHKLQSPVIIAIVTPNPAPLDTPRM